MKDTSILTNNGINVQASLELFGDMEMYDETLGDFLDMSDEKITTLENYKNANDMPNYAIAVHALKSDARYLGFTTLADLSYESEMKSKAGDSVFVAENHPKILQEAKRVINLSQQYMGREVTAVIPEGSAASAPVAAAVEAPVQPAAAPLETTVSTPVQPVVEQPVAAVATPVMSVTEVPAQSVSVPVEPVPVAQPIQNDVYVVQPTATVVPVQDMTQVQVPVQSVVEQPVQMVQPVMQTPVVPETPVTAMPVAPVQPAVVQETTPVAPVQPAVAPAPQEVQINFSNAGGPVSSQVQPAVSTEPTIQFFPADDYQQQDIMSHALSMQQNNMQSDVAAVKQGVILVVDDSPLVANFVKKIFSKSYEVIIASDGQKAIDIINDDSIRSKIKTCLLDLNMPNVSGFDVMDYFKEKGVFVRTPVAVISGAEDAPTLDKAKSYPIIDVLAKPFNERDVQRVVEKCLACYF